MVTNYCELICLNNKTAQHVAIQLAKAPLSCYSWAVHRLFNQGGEFIGHDFTRVLHNHGITPVPLPAKNLQSNAIYKQLHLTVSNILQTLVHFKSPIDIQGVVLLIDTPLQTAAYSECTVVHGNLKHSPGSLAFHCDMLFDIPHCWYGSDPTTATSYCQLNSLLSKQISCLTWHGDPVLIWASNPNKMDHMTQTNPFTITHFHANDTETIQHDPYAIKQINILRIVPYRQ